MSNTAQRYDKSYHSQYPAQIYVIISIKSAKCALCFISLSRNPFLQTMKLRTKQILREKGKTFQWLSAELGVSDTALRASLNGNPTLATLGKVAAALGVDITELFAPSGRFCAFVETRDALHKFTDKQKLLDFLNGDCAL